MITEHDLQEAIAECQGKRNPDASTCIKLAAFYTIKSHLYPDPVKRDAPEPVYSFSPGPDPEPVVEYQSGSEFSSMVDGRPQSEIFPLIEELVEAVQALNPRLYAGFIDRLR